MTRPTHPEEPEAQPDPRQRLRDLIAAKLCDKDAYCNECAVQAGAVMELFPEVELVQEGRYADGSWPQRAYEFPNYIDPTHTRYELSTAPEPIPRRGNLMHPHLLHAVAACERLRLPGPGHRRRHLEEAVVTYDPDTCEQIFHAALAAGDIQGVEAALTVMAPQDPHRAQELLDMVRVGLALADRRPTSDTPAVVRRRKP